MKAMIFAAGLGTRLKPVTDSIPKALVSVNGVTLLEFAVRKLLKHGFNEIIINVHHFPGQIEAYLREKDFFGASIEFSDESEMLLDTGGGLKKAAPFFNDGKPFLIYNCDIITSLDLERFYVSAHVSGSLAHLAVRRRSTSRYLLFSPEGELAGWENTNTGEKKIARQSARMERFAFSGIHVMSPELFSFFPDEQRFSLTDFYLALAPTLRITAFDHTEDFWSDIGKPAELKSISRYNLHELL